MICDMPRFIDTGGTATRLSMKSTRRETALSDLLKY